MNDEAQEKLGRIFMPYAMRRLDQVRQKKTKFAHYTSAYAAIQIIEKKTVWMRNAVVMNDFSEVQHGQECLIESWSDENVGGRLKALMKRIDPDLVERVQQGFNNRLHDREVQSYLISISEHGDGALDEDMYGRLSMWRAYGGDTNVAFVFNNKPFVSESNALNAFTSPVLYCDKEGFKYHFLEMIKGLEKNFDFLAEIGPDEVETRLFWALHFAALSTKHPGFSEEKEWRVIYSSTLLPSERIKFDIETLGGVPQKVYKLLLKNYPEEGFVGATLPEFLDEIIIGPTESPWPIYEALSTRLEENGVENAWSKVRISNIPLRR